MDFNTLRAFADRCARDGRYASAIAVYLYMAEGDASLDGGSLGHSIGECYEKLGDLHTARYWFGRAFEENPAIDLYRRDFDRTRNIGIEDLVMSA